MDSKMKKPTRKPSRWCYGIGDTTFNGPVDSLDELFDELLPDKQDHVIGEAKKISFARLVAGTGFRGIADSINDALLEHLEELVGDAAAEGALAPTEKDLDGLADIISKATERWLRATQTSIGCFEVENIRRVHISSQIWPAYATIPMETKES